MKLRELVESHGLTLEDVAIDSDDVLISVGLAGLFGCVQVDTSGLMHGSEAFEAMVRYEVAGCAQEMKATAKLPAGAFLMAMGAPCPQHDGDGRITRVDVMARRYECTVSSKHEWPELAYLRHGEGIHHLAPLEHGSRDSQ